MRKPKIDTIKISIQIDGYVEECPIIKVTPKSVMLNYKDKTVCISHTNFNFMLLHGEIDWHLTVSEYNGNNIYFLI